MRHFFLRFPTMTTCLAWNTPPSADALYAAAFSRPEPLHLLVCLTENAIPEFTATEVNTTVFAFQNNIAIPLPLWQSRLKNALQCLQFNSINDLGEIAPGKHLWVAPPAAASRLHEHFDAADIRWQTAPVPQQRIPADKPWFTPPPATRPERVLVIGAGIAGAATARLLAEQGVPVSVLEAAEAAQGGSGNRQGLLYAKISPHPTEQTELLLAGYGYTRRLLERLLPQAESWGAGGVVHLDYNEAERQRHQALGAQTGHRHLYRSVTPPEIRAVSGLDFPCGGLYWPQGVWLHPPALVRTLLDHPLITLHEHAPLQYAAYGNGRWTAYTPQAELSGSHIVYCTGAQSPAAADANIAALPYRLIRGQTGVAAASAFSQTLRCAVSGEGYISPAWAGQHCYGATFGINNADNRWHAAEELENRATLRRLHPELAASLFSDGLNPPERAAGHAALRCDSPDHLPLVGALGDIAAMQQVYAKLALDKNYRIDTLCPYLPNAYINTAHGTRGLATAPVCAAALTAEILGLPQPLSRRLRRALAPNRTVIRAIARQRPLLPE
ncbi:FAD-dependent 5-carboxymethylaminomethyl-2-thiouridine(34) oxidoreductase MnmC [Bergeriella denitrificans]|uniref:Putative oxidoreductase n=1 Tax=Bergeriella denitrificans TaxID=494 RepID=A0A378UGX9_BERDE|nr:FAD-dependent 5-carboxymethylaminomethyl-2-thiouridine(34) oxidoreductase MnmC [Bergeriella denitrificans]STZ76390.1 putative oxidoreductase [Bergeriella denitrificans]